MHPPFLEFAYVIPARGVEEPAEPVGLAFSPLAFIEVVVGVIDPPTEALWSQIRFPFPEMRASLRNHLPCVRSIAIDRREGHMSIGNPVQVLLRVALLKVLDFLKIEGPKLRPFDLGPGVVLRQPWCLPKENLKSIDLIEGLVHIVSVAQLGSEHNDQYDHQGEECQHNLDNLLVAGYRGRHLLRLFDLLHVLLLQIEDILLQLLVGGTDSLI
mmetsp:Transcript_34708/g.53240  ORF Transcript_34708/g.53240 Transcript_34708/m.53240 type:complete len:213 (-) Transcript_34708:1445-2083(-)